MIAKCLILALAVCVVYANVGPCVTECSEEQLKSEFNIFQRSFNKVYDNEATYNLRFKIFKENFARFAEQNKNPKGPTHSLRTPFADMTAEEFKARYLSPVHYTGHNDETTEFAYPTEAEVNAAPADKDWRKDGAVTGVKNQGQCGSCWSFSSTGDMEGTWFLAKNQLVALSEQQIVDCDVHGNDHGCEGGLPEGGFEYVIKAGGIETEADYPYEAVDAKCRVNSTDFAVTISNWTAVSKNEDDIAAFLAANGPLSIGINASHMQGYKSGIADPLFCDPAKLDHGVLIVGYGSHKGVFGSEEFWIIKNSWGTVWGEEGYYRIVKGKGKCGLNTHVTHSIV